MVLMLRCRVVNIAVPIVSAMHVSAIFSYDVSIIDMGIGDTFSSIFLQYSIPILLSSGALVNSVNNITTVPGRLKARTVVLHLN